MKTILLSLVALVTCTSCSTTTTTTTTRTDGKQTVVVTQKTVDGATVSSVMQLFVGGILSSMSSNNAEKP